MYVANGTERKTVNQADFDLVSAAHDRILLPYNGSHWGELNHEVMRLAYTKCFSEPVSGDEYLFYDQVIQKVTLAVLFNIQPQIVRLTAQVHIVAGNGASTNGKIFLCADDDETTVILDEFFRSGGQGVGESWLSYFRDNYERWRLGLKKTKVVLPFPLDKSVSVMYT